MRMNQLTGPFVRPLAHLLEKDDMKLLGLGATMRWANRYNRMTFGGNQIERQRLCAEELDSLLKENGAPQHEPVVMNDGWAMDTSRTLPHLNQLLNDSAEIIENRGMRPTEDHGKPFLLSIMKDEDLAKYPSVLTLPALG